MTKDHPAMRSNRIPSKKYPPPSPMELASMDKDNLWKIKLKKQRLIPKKQSRLWWKWYHSEQIEPPELNVEAGGRSSSSFLVPKVKSCWKQRLYGQIKVRLPLLPSSFLISLTNSFMVLVKNCSKKFIWQIPTVQEPLRGLFHQTPK